MSQKIPTFVTDEELPPIPLEHTGERQIGATLEQIAPDHRKRYEWAAKILKSAGVKTVLDAGCGNGYGSFILADQGGLDVRAVDISKEAIEFAKFFYQREGGENIDFEVCDLEELDPGKPDAIVCFEALEHIDAPKLVATFQKAAPILLCSVPNEEVMPFSEATHPFHLRHYTPDEFRELLAGYEIEMLTQYDKWTGDLIADHDDGRTLVADARRSV